MSTLKKVKTWSLIKCLNYMEEVLEIVYERMNAERIRIAEKYHSEGKVEAKEIEGQMEKDLKNIRSEAYRKAQNIKGKAVVVRAAGGEARG